MKAPYGWPYEGARERVSEGRSNGRRTCSLAGYMGVCSMARRGVREILRATLRRCLRVVLRSIFRAVLRNRGSEESSGRAKGLGSQGEGAAALTVGLGQHF